jgi:anti-sigma B factor antagonist
MYRDLPFIAKKSRETAQYVIKLNCAINRCSRHLEKREMRRANMNIKTENKNGIMVINVKEERLDAHNSGELKSEMQKQFDEGIKNILIDLKDVRFIDSSGLGALVSGFKNAISHQGNLKLSTLQPQVKSMFELTRLHRVFEIFSSTAEALDNY